MIIKIWAWLKKLWNPYAQYTFKNETGRYCTRCGRQKLLSDRKYLSKGWDCLRCQAAVEVEVEKLRLKLQRDIEKQEEDQKVRSLAIEQLKQEQLNMKVQAEMNLLKLLAKQQARRARQAYNEASQAEHNCGH